jgi:hypothetical protein
MTHCVHSQSELLLLLKDNDYNNEILQALLNSKESNFINTDYILNNKYLSKKPLYEDGFYMLIISYKTIAK